jgi:serine/threonine protein kinase
MTLPPGMVTIPPTRGAHRFLLPTAFSPSGATVANRSDRCQLGLLKQHITHLEPKGEQLGRGAAGCVTQQTATLAGDPRRVPETRTVAVKSYSNSMSTLTEGFVGCVLQDFAQHVPKALEPHMDTIAWIHQAVMNPDTYDICTVSISGNVGDLSTHMTHNRGGLGAFGSPKHLRSTFFDLVCAGRLLAAAGVCHNDIKAGNVIVTAWARDEEGREILHFPMHVALVDFASAFVYRGPTTVLTAVPRTTRHTCSPAYPGRFKDPVATSAFSIGIVMCNLLAGEEYATMGASIFARFPPPQGEREFTEAHARIKLGTFMALGGSEATTCDAVSAQILMLFPDIAYKYLFACILCKASGDAATLAKVEAFFEAVMQVVSTMVNMKHQFEASTGEFPPSTVLEDVIHMPLFTHPTLCDFSVKWPPPSVLTEFIRRSSIA